MIEVLKLIGLAVGCIGGLYLVALVVSRIFRER
jgi:hypothetical protein